MAYLYLFVAIIAEIFATTMLKDTNGFTVLFPSIFTIAGYILSFYMLSLCVQYIPTGIIYVSEAASLVEVVHGVRVTPPGRGITSGFGSVQPMLQPV